MIGTEYIKFYKIFLESHELGLMGIIFLLTRIMTGDHITLLTYLYHINGFGRMTFTSNIFAIMNLIPNIFSS